MQNDIPRGYMKDSSGRLVPQELVREQDKLRDGVVCDLIDDALRLNAELGALKKRALNDIEDVIQIAADKYDVSLGGEKGNITLTSFNGQYRVMRTYSERTTFTEELEAAKLLITECIDDWSDGANNNMRALVNRAFRTNGSGQVKTAEVLGLLRLEIREQKWQTAMQALKDSINISGSVVYVRFYKRIGETDQYQLIPLDLAGV